MGGRDRDFMKPCAIAILCAGALLAQTTVPNVAGKWSVSATSAIYPLSFQAAVPVSQSGGSISGQATFSGSPCAQSGAMSGTVSTNGSVTFTLNENGQIVSFSGKVGADGHSANGTYTAPAGGCTNGDSGVWSATGLASALPTPHFPIDITGIATNPWTIFSGGNTVPVGNQQYNNLPFHIPTGKNNAWMGWGDAVTTAMVRPNVVGATTVYTLIGTVWGQPGPTPYISLTFTGSGGATYTRNLVGGVDVRDFNGPSPFTDSINNTSTINVWTGPVYDGTHYHRLDEQIIALPSAFASQTLTAVTITDSGKNPNFQRAILSAVTVDGIAAPSGLTISGGNNQSGPGGAALPANLTVTVNGTGGAPIPGVLVDFAVTSGSATLSAASAVSGADGSASTGVTLGNTSGKVVVTATIEGSSLPGAQFTVTVIDPKCPIPPPVITSVKSATDYGGLASFAPGSWLEIKGTNLTIDANPRQWAVSDFQGPSAPTNLDGSGVSIDGHLAFVSYINSGQINAQAPADAMLGPVPITVTTCAGTSSSVSLPQASAVPGVLAPASFNIGGKQYMAATFADGVTFVGNVGLIAGAPFRPAKPGDTIILYGIGFGPVTPALSPGVVVSQTNSIPNLSVSFGATPASVSYAGLAGGFIGLYEIYLVVPQVPDGDYQVNISAGATPVPQIVYLTVHQ